MITIYDKVLSSMEMIESTKVDLNRYNNDYIFIPKEIDYKSKGKVIVELQLDNASKSYFQPYMLKVYNQDEINKTIKKQQSLKEENEKQAFLFSHIVFSAQEIILYRLLISNYILKVNTGKNITISLDEIHKELRKKYFKYGNEKYDEQTLRVYITSLMKLALKKVKIDFSNCKATSFRYHKNKGKSYFIDNLVHFKIPVEELNNISTSQELEYDLGEFGLYLRYSYHYNSYIPEQIYSVNFNQIDIFNMAMYIARMIYLNRRGKTRYSIYVKSILLAVNKYTRDGLTSNKSYISHLIEQTPKKRVKLMEQLYSQINYIMEVLSKEGKIKSYSISGKWKYKFLIEKELKINITF